MEDLLLRADGKRRGLLLVKRTEADEVLSPFLEAHVLGNDIHDVIGRADFLEFSQGGFSYLSNGIYPINIGTSKSLLTLPLHDSSRSFRS